MKSFGPMALAIGMEHWPRRGVANVAHLGTDSSSAKSFVSRRGLGKMRHVDIRDLWFQKKVREGKVLVHEVE